MMKSTSPDSGRPVLCLVKAPCRAGKPRLRRPTSEGLSDCVSIARDMKDLFWRIRRRMSGAMPADIGRVESILKQIEREQSAMERLFATGKLTVPSVGPLLRPFYKHLSALSNAHPSGQWFDGTATSVEAFMRRLVQVATGIGVKLDGAVRFHVDTRRQRARTNRRRVRLCLV